MKTACEKILVKAVLPSLWKNKNFGHPTTALSRELTNTGTGIRWVVRNNDRLQVSEINGVPSKLQHIQIGDSKAVIMMDFEVGVISSVHMAKTINFTKLGLLEMASVEHGVNNWLAA